MSELTFDDLSDDQKKGHDRVIKNIQNKVHTTITGGPGVGKTTLVKFIFETLKSMGISGLWLTAPRSGYRYGCNDDSFCFEN